MNIYTIKINGKSKNWGIDFVQNLIDNELLFVDDINLRAGSIDLVTPADNYVFIVFDRLGNNICNTDCGEMVMDCFADLSAEDMAKLEYFVYNENPDLQPNVCEVNKCTVYRVKLAEWE